MHTVEGSGSVGLAKIQSCAEAIRSATKLGRHRTRVVECRAARSMAMADDCISASVETHPIPVESSVDRNTYIEFVIVSTESVEEKMPVDLRLLR